MSSQQLETIYNQEQLCSQIEQKQKHDAQLNEVLMAKEEEIKCEKFDSKSLTNYITTIIKLLINRQVPVHRLETILGKSNAARCVEIRRQYYVKELEALDKLDQNNQRDYQDKPISININQILSSNNTFNLSRADVLRETQNQEFAFDRVVGACCENVIGYVRLPVGLVGPLILDDKEFFVPLATTEGCLVASTKRGLSALEKSGGVFSRIRRNCMTRAPIVRFQDTDLRKALNEVDRAIDWLQDPFNRERIKTAFRSTSRHTTLVDYTLHPEGRAIHIRFQAKTGDAMGMNMCSKGAEAALKDMQKEFPSMEILTLSGNMCTDKKPSAINWILGRGKSVECNALIPIDVVEKVLKVPVDNLIEVWREKVMIGSAKAGSIGGFNCHAANIVAAIFIATGQDAAQVVSSSNCLLTLGKDSRGSLEVNCSMPSIECGTVGGGTVLPDQSGYLQLMGIRGSTTIVNQDESLDSEQIKKELDSDSNNACTLARVICATVMAAELSLLASLTEGTLVKSHMTHNRLTQPCKVV